MTVPTFEQRARRIRDLRNPVQVVGGGDDRRVSHVHGESGQARLHIGAVAIPAQQYLHGKAVA